MSFVEIYKIERTGKVYSWMEKLMQKSWWEDLKKTLRGMLLYYLSWETCMGQKQLAELNIGTTKLDSKLKKRVSEYIVNCLFN